MPCKCDHPSVDDPPFWKTNWMQDESLLFVRPVDGRPAQAQLLFTPLDTPRLSSATGLEQYEPGTDYHWAAGSRTIRLLPGSRVSALDEDELYPPRGSQKFGTCRDRDADLLFGEGVYFHNLQSAAAYRHARDGWTTPPTLDEPVRWPDLAARLAQRGRLRLVLLGDSISVGHNASGLCGTAPDQPGYGSLLAAALQRWTGRPVDFVNLSVGGMGSEWGLEQMDKVLAAQPDLLLLAFGMNDASVGVPADQFFNIMRSMIQRLSGGVPHARGLVVSPMSGHPQWTGTDLAAYPRYRDSLLGLRREGVAVADVTSVWQWVVGRKKDLDLTGNGLNHPNDFGHRLYAQVIGSVLRQALTMQD